MSDLEPLACIGCVRRVDPLSDQAEGWVLVPHSVDESDDHDDSQWKCPDCATASESSSATPIGACRRPSTSTTTRRARPQHNAHAVQPTGA